VIKQKNPTKQNKNQNSKQTKTQRNQQGEMLKQGINKQKLQGQDQ
jgi:hypothetical protein